MPDIAHIGARVGVVVIGRNEGDRLRRCLASLADMPIRIYVDSASTDGSIAAARSLGVDVVALTAPPRLTAARGRNAGLAALVSRYPDVEYVQFVDGDCDIQPGWIKAGVAALDADAGLALVFGRRRERFPDRSIYNALCDDEWDVPVGEALACGGDILCRIDAVRSIDGYDEAMIAGEDPDLSTRLRKAGWRLRRIANDMTLHDAAILSFGQWWTRMTRGGHAVAELADRHPGIRAPAWRRRCRSILFWGLALPLAILAMAVLAALVDVRLLIVAAAMLLAWPLQMARIAFRRRHRLPGRVAAAYGVSTMVGKFAELAGLLRFERSRWGGTKAGLIEYKKSTPAPPRAR